MNTNLTELVAILDMSGSMYSLTDDTIGGYNALLEEQKKAPGDANLTTVLFDERYILLHDRVDINNVKPLTREEYRPQGMTAMLDAVGKTIVDIGRKLAAMPEEERPGSVIVTIITDGYENASREYTWQAIHEMIKEQREKYSWIFTFIGANIDVENVSDMMGIDKRYAKKYTADRKGTSNVYATVSKAMSYSRSYSCSTGENINYSACCMDEFSSILDNIKEDPKEK